MEFERFIETISQYLDKNYYCKKHKIEHTGKNAYALDFYSYLGDFDKAKKLVFKILDKVVEDNGHTIFYPGSINHYNKSNNVIDCGIIVDSISRFMSGHKDIFGEEEIKKIDNILYRVVYSYLIKAAVVKPITNQRLWGSTGLASYYNYKKDDLLLPIIEKSIEISLSEMTSDGFFIYHPHAEDNRTFGGYRGLTTYYQSRCTAFIYYAILDSGLDLSKYEEKLERSIDALISMYKKEGYKDLSLECKRWYWLSDYEVASNTFDIYALSKSKRPLSKKVLLKSLEQIKNHISNGYLNSHNGRNYNYQCNLFWNAHLAWILRTDNIESLWNESSDTKLDNIKIKLDKVINIYTSNYQIILNNFWQDRNYTTGIFDNGLPQKYNKKFYKLGFIKPNKNVLISIKENLYHSKVALRTFNFGEAFVRLIKMMKNIFISFLPIYSLKYGKVDKFIWYDNDNLEFNIHPATRFGHLLKDKKFKVALFFDSKDYKINISKQ